MLKGQAVVFTDLDATLLDHHDYDWSAAAAAPALARLAERGVPVYQQDRGRDLRAARGTWQ